MYQPETEWAEQDPSDWSEAAISTIKSVVEKVRLMERCAGNWNFWSDAWTCDVE